MSNTPDDTQPRGKSYRWCKDCGTLLGRTSYSFGTHTPLCEVCMDRRERKSVRAHRGKGRALKTWTDWITAMAWWRR